MKRRLIIIVLAIFPLLFAGCEKNSFSDGTEFQLHYMGITNMHPGETATSGPSYIGKAPTDFVIYTITLNGNIYYNPKLDGELNENSIFYVNPTVGTFRVQNSSSLRPGTYKVGISCKSGGKKYSYPEAVSVVVVKDN